MPPPKDPRFRKLSLSSVIVDSMAAASSSPEIRMVVLRSSDGETFELEEAAARMSEMVKNMIEDGCAGDVIPLPNVDSTTLSKVAQYCRRLAASSPDPNESLESFEAKFMDEVKDDKPRLFQLILAANYLAIKGLMDLACKTTASIIKPMSAEEMRSFFGIENDYNPEDEAKIREEYGWAFE